MGIWLTGFWLSGFWLSPYKTSKSPSLPAGSTCTRRLEDLLDLALAGAAVLVLALALAVLVLLLGSVDDVLSMRVLALVAVGAVAPPPLPLGFAGL